MFQEQVFWKPNVTLSHKVLLQHRHLSPSITQSRASTTRSPFWLEITVAWVGLQSVICLNDRCLCWSGTLLALVLFREQRFLKGPGLPPHLGRAYKRLVKGWGVGEGGKGPLFFPRPPPFRRRDTHSNCDHKMLFLWAIPVATFVYLAQKDLYWYFTVPSSVFWLQIITLYSPSP